MVKNKINAGAGGIGVTGMLQVAFIVLKLCKVINWSWWWVLAPTWIGLVLAAIIIAIIVIAALNG
jgi:hypothetical protein